jgi:hypothetical protein
MLGDEMEQRSSSKVVGQRMLATGETFESKEFWADIPGYRWHIIIRYLYDHA